MEGEQNCTSSHCCCEPAQVHVRTRAVQPQCVLLCVAVRCAVLLLCAAMLTCLLCCAVSCSDTDGHEAQKGRQPPAKHGVQQVPRYLHNLLRCCANRQASQSELLGVLGHQQALPAASMARPQTISLSMAHRQHARQSPTSTIHQSHTVLLGAHVVHSLATPAASPDEQRGPGRRTSALHAWVCMYATFSIWLAEFTADMLLSCVSCRPHQLRLWHRALWQAVIC
jgi:hypothetical protein